MKIIKADGTQEEFDARKLEKSLKKSGAKKSEVENILRTVEQQLTPQSKSHDIYRLAFSLLSEQDSHIALKYSLRRAIFNLGPSGFPFEDYLARIFEAEGYATKRRLILKGKCATHEIDLAGYAPHDSFIAEAKFHMRPGIKSDLQVALYSYARFLDLESGRICKADVCGIISHYVITNTKFTHAAISYAKCTGVRLLSWDYPKQDSLQNKVERHGLYPVTALTSLSDRQKRLLIENECLLITDIALHPGILKMLTLSKKQEQALLDEVLYIQKHATVTS